MTTLSPLLIAIPPAIQLVSLAPTTADDRIFVCFPPPSGKRAVFFRKVGGNTTLILRWTKYVNSPQTHSWSPWGLILFSNRGNVSFQTANCLLPELKDALISFMEESWGEWEEDRATEVVSTAFTNGNQGRGWNRVQVYGYTETIVLDFMWGKVGEPACEWVTNVCAHVHYIWRYYVFLALFLNCFRATYKNAYYILW